MIRALYKKIAKDNFELNKKEIKDGAHKLSSLPIFFNLDLIGVCNMQPRCVMCYEINSSTRLHPGISIADILNFGDFFEKASSLINCSIGEPLMHKDIVELIALIDSKGKEIGLNTNGLALNSRLSDALLKYPEALNLLVSLDAGNPSTYSKLKGDFFEKVASNVSYFCKKKKMLGHKKDGRMYPRIGFCFMPMKLNKDEIVTFIKLSSDIGVDRVELRCLNKVDKNIIIERGGFISNYNEQLLSKKEWDELEAVASIAAKRYGISLEFQYRSDKSDAFDFFLPREFADTGMKCTLPWRFILPYKNGETTGCCCMNRSLGNWRKDGLLKLWNSPRMQKMRLELGRGNLSGECLRYKHCPIVAKYAHS